jgi:hypothetical protein
LVLPAFTLIRMYAFVAMNWTSLKLRNRCRRAIIPDQTAVYQSTVASLVNETAWFGAAARTGHECPVRLRENESQPGGTRGP